MVLQETKEWEKAGTAAKSTLSGELIIVLRGVNQWDTLKPYFSLLGRKLTTCIPDDLMGVWGG